MTYDGKRGSRANVGESINTQFSAVDDTLKNANCECLLGKVCHIGRFCQVFDICLLGCIILMRIIYGKKSKSNIGTADNILSLALHY